MPWRRWTWAVAALASGVLGFALAGVLPPIPLPGLGSLLAPASAPLEVHPLPAARLPVQPIRVRGVLPDRSIPRGERAQQAEEIVTAQLDGSVPAHRLQTALHVDAPVLSPDSPPSDVWTWGPRRAWQFSFDGETGDLYIADVGQVDGHPLETRCTGSTAPGPPAAEGEIWSILAAGIPAAEVRE